MLRNGKFLDHKYIVKEYAAFIERDAFQPLDKFSEYILEQKPEWGKLSRQVLHYVLKNTIGGLELLAKRRSVYRKK